MTNEEAIDVLEHNFPSSCYADLCEAVNVAIEALQRETSDDAISRRAAIEGLKGYIDDTGIFNQDKWFVHGIKTAITHLKSLPSAQPEPCKSIENILEYLDDVLHPIVSPDNWNVYSELYDMISDLPSVQPDVPDTNVGDLISRQVAIDICHKNYDGILDFRSDGWTVASSFEDIINSVPSAQPEIVPCGDCKHWICHDRRCGYWNHGVKPLEWCCHAERKENR